MWTNEEIEKLIRIYPEEGKKETMRILGKTEAQIRQKASILNLTLNKNGKFFKEFQNRAAASKIGKKRPEHSALMISRGKKKELWQQTNPAPITTHNISKTQSYIIWNGMMSRCYRDKNIAYSNYGGRGIKVCEEWKDPLVFKRWYESHNDGSIKRANIDRIDTNGNYEPENCRIISPKQNCRNKRNNILLEYNGEKKSMAEWAEQYGLKYHCLNKRITKYKWDTEKALTEKVMFYHPK